MQGAKAQNVQNRRHQAGELHDRLFHLLQRRHPAAAIADRADEARCHLPRCERTWARAAPLRSSAPRCTAQMLLLLLFLLLPTAMLP